MRDRRDILMVSAAPYPGLTGSQVYVGALSRGLAVRGHRLRLLSYGPVGGGPVPDQGFEVIHPDLPSSPAARAALLRPGPGPERLRHDRRLRALLGRILSSSPPQVVLCQHLPALLAAVRVAEPHVPLIYCAHSDVVEELPEFLRRRIPLPGAAARLAGRLLGRREAAALRRCAGWTAVNPALAKVLQGRGGAGKPWASVPPALPDDDPARAVAGPLPGEPTAAWSGSFDPFQNLELLAAAWPAVRGAVPEARLLLVTHDERLLPDMLRQPGVEHRRAADWPEAVGILSTARVFCIPRKQRGGSPVKLFNAMAMGRAVLTTPAASDGVLEDGLTGRVVAPHPGAWSAALIELLRPEGEAPALGSAALEEEERSHRSARRVAALEGLLERVVP